MRPQHQDRLVAVALQERAPRRDRLAKVGVEVAAPFRMRHLHRMMHQVAGDHRLLPARGDSHAEMAGRMAGSRLEPDLIRDPRVAFDQFGQPGIETGRTESSIGSRVSVRSLDQCSHSLRPIR